MTAAALLVGATIAVLGACLLLIIAVVGVRARRGRRDRRDAMLLAPLRGPLITVASGEDDDGSAAEALTWATGVSRAVLDRKIVAVLGKIRGAPAEQLVGVLTVHGAVDRAAVDLTARSPVRRARAAQLLGLSRSPDAVPRLVSALDDPSAEVRNSAAYGLGLIGDASAAGAVLAAIGAPDRGLPASTAAEALQSMGVEIAGVLGIGLADPDPRTRMVAAHVTGEGSFIRGLPQLRDLLAADPDLTVRETAAVAIGHIGRPDDVGVLSRHTAADQPLDLRRAATAALDELGEPAAVPALTGLLDDPDPRLAEMAAAALIGLGAPGLGALSGREDLAPVRSARLIAGLQGARA